MNEEEKATRVQIYASNPDDLLAIDEACTRVGKSRSAFMIEAALEKAQPPRWRYRSSNFPGNFHQAAEAIPPTWDVVTMHSLSGALTVVVYRERIL